MGRFRDGKRQGSRAADWGRYFQLMGALSGFVHLAATVLVAVEAGRSEVAQIVGAAVHSRLFVLDGHPGRSDLCERALTVATLPALASRQLPTYPRAILRTIEVLHIAEYEVNRHSHVNAEGNGWLKLSINERTVKLHHQGSQSCMIGSGRHQCEAFHEGSGPLNPLRRKASGPSSPITTSLPICRASRSVAISEILPVTNQPKSQ